MNICKFSNIHSFIKLLSLILFLNFATLADLVERTVRKHFNYDHVAKFELERIVINTIILFFSDKN